MKNLTLATAIWHSQLTPMQRIEIIKLYNSGSISKKYRSCINHIANNLEQYQ